MNGEDITSIDGLAAHIERIQRAHVVDAVGDGGIQFCACGAQLGMRSDAPAQHVAREVAQWVLQRNPDEEPSIYVQWKGTDVCLDFYCPCGEQSHYDGYFAYAIECPACQARFDLPAHPHLLPFSGSFDPKVASLD